MGTTYGTHSGYLSQVAEGQGWSPVDVTECAGAQWNVNYWHLLLTLSSWQSFLNCCSEEKYLSQENAGNFSSNSLANRLQLSIISFLFTEYFKLSLKTNKANKRKGSKEWRKKGSWGWWTLKSVHYLFWPHCLPFRTKWTRYLPIHKTCQGLDSQHSLTD